MVSIGRNNIRSRMTPSNQGLARRIDTKLDGVVDAFAAKFKTALAVDGVTCFIFNKHRGNVPCTCRGFQNLNNFASHEVGLTGREASRGTINLMSDGKTRISESFLTDNGNIREVASLTPSDLDNLFQQNNETIVQKITNDDPNQEPDSDFVNDPFDDVVDALFSEEGAPIYSGDGDPMKQLLSGTSLQNSTDFPFSSGMVTCPICFGAGSVDSWRLYNGERVVLDASTMYTLDIFNDVEIDQTSQPAVYSVAERSYLQWSNVSLPTSWRHLMRLAVFNRGREIPTSDYNLYMIHPSQPTVRNPINYQILSQLNNSALLQQGNKLTFELESNLGPYERLVFTHVEFLFSTGELVYCQVPEASIADEDEYIDWNLNLTMEVASDVQLRENSFIVDGKYQRVWKVTEINRRQSAQMKSFGYSVTVRPLHSFEKSYTLMNVFKKIIDPFNSPYVKESIAEDY